MASPFFAAPGSSTTPPQISPMAAPVLHQSGAVGSPQEWQDISLHWLHRAGHLAMGSPSPVMDDAILTHSTPASPRPGNSSLDSASSPCTSTSSRSHSLRDASGAVNVQENEERQRRKKRKSPCTTMLLFRSPLSRMLLSPQLRSPAARHGRSPLAATCSRADNGIDLNLEPDESAPEDAQNGSDIGGDPHTDLNVENGADTGGIPHAQENARRLIVRDEKRRAIFESLVAKARKGCLKGHETKEVSEEFSVPLRTVQRILKGSTLGLEGGGE